MKRFEALVIPGMVVKVVEIRPEYSKCVLDGRKYNQVILTASPEVGMLLAQSSGSCVRLTIEQDDPA